MRTETRELLDIANFRKLLVARTISNFGNGLAPIALAFGVLDLEGATPATLSIVMAAQLFPIVAFMLVGGVIADRFPRALVVGASDILLSALVVGNGISFITHTATITSLVIIALLSGTLNAAWWPAFSGIVPEVVPEEQLQSANSFVGLVSNTSNIFGIVSGGILVAAIGSGPAIVVDGLTFLVAGILVFQLRGLGNRRNTELDKSSIRDDLMHGWQEFTSRKWVWTVVAGYSIIVMMFESALSVIGPYHAKTVLGGPRPWSWILAAFSVGMVLGVIATMRIKPRHPIFVGLSLQFALAAWFASIGLTTNIPIIMLTGFVCGFAMDFFMVIWQTALQTHIPRESLSRVVSYDAFGSLFFAPLGLLLAGPLVIAIGTQHSLLWFAAITSLVLIAMLSVKDVRALEQIDATDGSISLDH